MKIKEGYILNEIGGTSVAIYIGEDDNGLNGIVKLNKLGLFLWEKLEEGASMLDLVKAVTGKYDVDEKRAINDIKAFVDVLRRKNILSE